MFTSTLANEAAAAVQDGQFKSIVFYFRSRFPELALKSKPRKKKQPVDGAMDALASHMPPDTAPSTPASRPASAPRSRKASERSGDKPSRPRKSAKREKNQTPGI